MAKRRLNENRPSGEMRNCYLFRTLIYVHIIHICPNAVFILLHATRFISKKILNVPRSPARSPPPPPPPPIRTSERAVMQRERDSKWREREKTLRQPVLSLSSFLPRISLADSDIPACLSLSPLSHFRHSGSFPLYRSERNERTSTESN